MDVEEIGFVALHIFFAMSLVGILFQALDISITSGQAIEFIISLIVYHLIVRNTIYKTFFSVKKSDSTEKRSLARDDLFPFIVFSIISMTTSAIIMYMFGVHLDGNVQAALEMLAIYCYQWFITKSCKPTI